jgi:putative ABC transport system ATP-binding protein
MLTVNHLAKKIATKDYQLEILHDISFSIDEGKSLSILGESGSGKTTLLGLLAGLDRPTEGEVQFKGRSIFELSEDERTLWRKDYLGFVFQNFQLIDGLTALENVAMPLELKDDSEALDKAEQICQQVGIGHRLKHYPNQLSGGEQQRVAIARAFVSQPKLLLADEPTGNLDTATGEKIIELMFNLNKAFNTTLVLVTHDKKLAKMCDQSITLSGGKIISQQKNS